MWYSSLLQRPNRRQMARKQSSYRPTLEALEDRWVPSTLTVSNNLDSGAGSLRADIAAARSGDTIVFAPSVNGQTITLTSGELLIGKNLTITGPSDRSVTISGGGLSRVFDVAKGSQVNLNLQVALSGLTISNGAATSSNSNSEGGGILNEGTLTVSNCTLSGNTAFDGGGIGSEGALTVTGCSIANNTCFSAFNNNTHGGGIFAGRSGTLIVGGCTMSGNSAGNGGAIANSGHATIGTTLFSGNSATYFAGGAIDGGGTESISSCTFKTNSAFSGGGAISVEGGTWGISGCILSGNNASNWGGGLFVNSTSSTVTLTNDTMTSNTATAGYGGGVYIFSGAGVSIDAFTIANIIDNTDNSGLNGPTANIDGTYSKI